MSRLLLEVIVQSLEDAREAVRGGADRLEVVRAIRDGGLTPPLSLVRAIAAEILLPIRVIVRENAGFGTDPSELASLRRDARELEALAVDGLGLGFARDGELALEDVGRVLEQAPQVRVTFHRAFDSLRDPLGAIDRMTTMPQIDRILTSGGEGTVQSRCERLRRYVARAGSRLEILAGGNMTEEMLACIAATASVREVHVGRAARPDFDPDARVSADRVKRLRDLCG